MVEFLEKLGVEFRCEQWIVRESGVTATAHVYTDEDVRWLREVEAHTRPWLGFSHPRVAAIRSLSWSGDHLVIVTGDERGPLFLQAAKRLAEPREREAWAVAELAAIAEAIDAMARHEPGFIHRRLHEQLVVGADGHARLRAPIAFVQAYREGNYVGRGHSVGTPDGLSPEQIRGVRVTPASDVFTLATLLYTAIALKKPFGGADDTDFGRLQAIIDAKQPPPPSETLGVWAVLKRSLAREPAERYPTPGAFADALRTAADTVAPASALTKLAAFEPGRRPAPNRSLIAGDRCAKRWSELAPTGADGIRHCASCKHDVVEVRSIEALVPLLGKRCVAYRPEN